MGYTPRQQQGDPQQQIDALFRNLISEKSSFVHNILRGDSALKYQDPRHEEGGLISGQCAGSYEAAREACVEQVSRIVHRCRRKNEKFTDPDFDIRGDADLLDEQRETLHGLPNPASDAGWGQSSNNGDGWRKIVEHETTPDNAVQDQHTVPADKLRYVHKSKGKPGSARRLTDIFDDPLFAQNAPRRHLTTPHCTAFTRVIRRLRPPTLVMESHWALYLAVILLRIGGLLTLKAFSGIIGLLLFSWAVTWICQHSSSSTPQPRFSTSQIKQGTLGNCWWIAAVTALCRTDDLLQRVCVAWDQQCGVYGFVFYRDGQWTFAIVDDYLYLAAEDYYQTKEFKATGDRFCSNANTHSKVFQCGPEALFFASCGEQEHTWLPLLEKAYAKAHGDYDAIEAGYPSAAIEDLTGGISTCVLTNGLLDTDDLWRRLHHYGDRQMCTLVSQTGGGADFKDGLTLCHAFTLERTYTIYLDGWVPRKTRLLKISNPWHSKKGVWQGDWGVGSNKWNPLTMWWLGAHPQQDGSFYMKLEDALETFSRFEFTKVLEDTKWTTKQRWAKMNASWVPQYNAVFFRLHLTTASRTVFALSQLDHRYYKGLQGRYDFRLEFIVRDTSAPLGQNIAHAAAVDWSPTANRCQLAEEEDLEPGTYDVHVKVVASVRERNLPAWSVEDVVKQSLAHPKKLQQLARNYDTAHRKLEIFDQDWNAALPEDLAAKESPKKKKQVIEATDVESPQSDPNKVAWNAVCGVGLRVLSKDPEMRLELPHRDEGNMKDGKEDEDADEWGQGAKSEAKQNYQDSCRDKVSAWDAGSGKNDDWEDREMPVGWAVALELGEEKEEDDLDSIYERKLGGMDEVLCIRKEQGCSPEDFEMTEELELAQLAQDFREPVDGYF